MTIPNATGIVLDDGDEPPLLDLRTWMSRSVRHCGSAQYQSPGAARTDAGHHWRKRLWQDRAIEDDDRSGAPDEGRGVVLTASIWPN